MTSTRKLAAILSADVFGYSRMMGEDDQATVEALNACKSTMRALVAEHGGRVVDSPGDEMLAEFPSAVEAVKAAIEIQDKFAERNAMRPESRKMRWRIGINLGDVIEENGTLYGDGVNIAARLQSLGQPGGLCISGTVFDHVDGKLPVKLEEAEEQAVKNIAKRVRVYHWAQGKGPETPQAPVQPSHSSRKGVLAGALAIASVLIGVMAWQYSHRTVAPPAVSSSVADPVFAMPTGPTVAVLPFASMSGDPTQKYFADGLTEDIITELSRYKDIYVLARNTTFQYKGQYVDVPALGKKLGAKYVLEGSVRKSADQVRITAQLIDVQSGVHVWAQRYDRELKDIFLVQEALSTKIAASIAGERTGTLVSAERKRAETKSQSELQAYDYVLEAVSGEWRTPAGYPKGKALLEKAIALEPNYARARREYAWITLIGWIFRFEKSALPPREFKENAIRSVELDPTDPYAHRTAAFGYYFDRQFGPFEREVEQALSLTPNNPSILSTLGFLIAIHGPWETGVKLVTKGHDLNAVSAGGWYNSAHFYNYFRRGMYREALEIVKTHPNLSVAENQQKFVAVYAELGNLDKAKEHWAKCVELEADWSASRLLQIGELWSFDKTFWHRYMQSIAKAGYTVTK